MVVCNSKKWTRRTERYSTPSPLAGGVCAPLRRRARGSIKVQCFGKTCLLAVGQDSVHAAPLCKTAQTHCRQMVDVPLQVSHALRLQEAQAGLMPGKPARVGEEDEDGCPLCDHGLRQANWMRKAAKASLCCLKKADGLLARLQRMQLLPLPLGPHTTPIWKAQGMHASRRWFAQGQLHSPSLGKGVREHPARSNRGRLGCQSHAAEPRAKMCGSRWWRGTC